MKISLLGPTYPFRGGIAHHTTLLCRALRLDHDVQFLSFTRQYPALLYPGRSDRDPSRAPMRETGVLYVIDSVNPFSWSRAVDAIVEFGPDLVVFPWWVAFWAPQYLYIVRGVRHRTRARVAIICHNVVEHESNRLKRLLTRLVLARADRLITHSAAESEELRRLLDERADIVTAFLPSLAEFNREPPSKAEARRRLDLSGDVLLFFGLVREYKGLGVLLESMPAVLAERPVTLLIAGEFWKDKEAYLTQITRLGIGHAVRIVDRYIPDEEIGDYFSAVDLVVQPYLSATGSAVLQLAWAFDRPAVATRVGSLPDVIQDGVNGRLVPPGDSRALARAILESLEPATLARYAREVSRARDRFSWARFAAVVVGEDRGKTQHEHGMP